MSWGILGIVSRPRRPAFYPRFTGSSTLPSDGAKIRGRASIDQCLTGRGVSAASRPIRERRIPSFSPGDSESLCSPHQYQRSSANAAVCNTMHARCAVMVSLSCDEPCGGCVGPKRLPRCRTSTKRCNSRCDRLRAVSREIFDAARARGRREEHQGEDELGDRHFFLPALWRGGRAAVARM